METLRRRFNAKHGDLHRYYWFLEIEGLIDVYEFIPWVKGKRTPLTKHQIKMVQELKIVHDKLAEIDARRDVPEKRKANGRLGIVKWSACFLFPGSRRFIHAVPDSTKVDRRALCNVRSPYRSYSWKLSHQAAVNCAQCLAAISEQLNDEGR
jgi:hypothetical protein